MSITLTQLRAFLAVVHSGSVTAAADELIVTQSSVSAAVSGLARELGTPLLERDGRGVRPTPAGAAFAPFATDVIGLLEQGRRAAVESAENASRTLRIAAVTTSAESFVPRLMQAFATAHPGVGLTLDVGNRDRVMGLVLAHQADVAFAGRPPRDARLEARALHPNEHVLITAPDDELAARAEVAPHELAARTWLLREPGSGTRSVNEDFLAATGLAPRTLTVGSNGAIRQAARARLGVSFVSRDAVADDLATGLLAAIAVTSAPAPRAWHVLCSGVGPVRPVVATFLDFITARGG
ncbi:LysR family transcriptional regulator [Solirubrobacter ginsenosidimutans]|uniref:LysR family transcriptional regulator n=1 Tax=Solirubrobacter ginsenosidimutans TaxID=490573 RepID=A0A9X3MUM1_9ACTN|nr:LysR family transcriptional regulator [Solirubrobacter ginsenosidimutans]MDA0162236.1 LysR family transcriptional regulator [Solirubrobacter ginsenosidimutans]